jgi:hypothetical protein
MIKRYLTILFLFAGLSSQGQDIKYEGITIGCLNLTRINKESIVRSNDEYQKVFESRSPHPDCGSYSPPEIDFSKSTLLGFLINTKGCSEPELNFRVFKSENNVVFNVDVIENGMCKMLFQKIIWITIPKESGEQFKFVSSYKLKN